VENESTQENLNFLSICSLKYSVRMILEAIYILFSKGYQHLLDEPVSHWVPSFEVDVWWSIGGSFLRGAKCG
jgi:hypothetical protein